MIESLRLKEGLQLIQSPQRGREAPPCWFTVASSRLSPGPLREGGQRPLQEQCHARQGTGDKRPFSSSQPEFKDSISLFMAYVHTTVNEMSQLYLATERRFNYTTPKTFLEQIKLYQNLLAKKRMELVAKIERLENGLMKLQSTASQVGRTGTRTQVPRGRKMNTVPCPGELPL